MATNFSIEGALEASRRHPLGWTFGVRSLFYAVTPEESSFADRKDVPDYVNKAAPFFSVFIALEMIVLAIQKKPLPRFNDAFSSMSSGIILTMAVLVVRDIEISTYIWVYEHWLLYELPWDSTWTWVFCFLGTDLGFYWLHRMTHEINFIWASHQFHHSSEDYNLTTALRQPLLQKYSTWIVYLPMALFVPPQIFMVHIQFNLLYQFWIHTEVIDNIGPLELILNTPSHHRVHHGRNRYCIDKNYGGVLIIWDRIFGTFEAERDKNEIAYGLVHPLNSWDCIYAQLGHWKWILKCVWNRPGLANKLSTLVKGPGWEPGKPRMGLIEDIPDIKAPQRKYNKRLPLFASVYTWIHLIVAFMGQQVLTELKDDLSPMVVLLFTLFLLWTLTNQGYLYEHKWFAVPLEISRCLVYLAMDMYIHGGLHLTGSPVILVIRVIYLFSTVLWTIFVSMHILWAR